MELTSDDFFASAETIWTSVLGTDLLRAPLEDGKVEQPQVTACVNITGDWQGAITVKCSSRVAGEIASAMFAMDASELSEEEISDAMGEIANMTGGSVKAVVPGNNTLALPSVSTGNISIPHSRVLHEVVGVTFGEPVVFSVLTRDN